MPSPAIATHALDDLTPAAGVGGPVFPDASATGLWLIDRKALTRDGPYLSTPLAQDYQKTICHSSAAGHSLMRHSSSRILPSRQSLHLLRTKNPRFEVRQQLY